MLQPDGTSLPPQSGGWWRFRWSCSERSRPADWRLALCLAAGGEGRGVPVPKRFDVAMQWARGRLAERAASLGDQVPLAAIDVSKEFESKCLARAGVTPADAMDTCQRYDAMLRQVYGELVLQPYRLSAAVLDSPEPSGAQRGLGGLGRGGGVGFEGWRVQRQGPCAACVRAATTPAEAAATLASPPPPPPTHPLPCRPRLQRQCKTSARCSGGLSFMSRPTSLTPSMRLRTQSARGCGGPRACSREGGSGGAPGAAAAAAAGRRPARRLAHPTRSWHGTRSWR